MRLREVLVRVKELLEAFFEDLFGVDFAFLGTTLVFFRWLTFLSIGLTFAVDEDFLFAM